MSTRRSPALIPDWNQMVNNAGPLLSSDLTMVREHSLHGSEALFSAIKGSKE